MRLQIAKDLKFTVWDLVSLIRLSKEWYSPFFETPVMRLC